MQSNWSLILNVLLLIGVVIAIGRLMKARRSLPPPSTKPSLGPNEGKVSDEIIAVRKVNYELQNQEKGFGNIVIKTTSEPAKKPPFEEKQVEEVSLQSQAETGKSLMMFLLAKENRQLAGYELLQTILAAGLRFGEGQLFHRHHHVNGQGPVLCSLAAATASGVFDLQNIGAFSVRGLCLFMQVSGNPSIDQERLLVMYETAKYLSEGLDTHLLDEQKQPLNEASLQRYRNQLSIEDYESTLA